MAIQTHNTSRSNTRKRLFVPTSLAKLQLNVLNPSLQLAVFLRSFRIRTLGEIHGFTISDFQNAGTRARSFFEELSTLLENARALPKQSPTQASSVSTKIAPIERLSNSSNLNKLGPSGPAPTSDDLIFIPDEFRSRPLREFSVSVRLQHILHDVKLLGDLHRTYFSALLSRRNCGKKSLEELRGLIAMLQSGHLPSSGPAVAETAPIDPLSVPIQIPTDAKAVPLEQIPLSVRLENVLRQRGAAKLGDLHGQLPSDLLFSRNCGKKTVAELQQLLTRIAAGEFAANSPKDLSSLLNACTASIHLFIQRMPDRDRAIFLDRLSGNNGKPNTLETVAKRFGLTRERVRQIGARTIKRMRRALGPCLADTLSQLRGRCASDLILFTPYWLERWTQPATHLQKNALLYVQILSTLDESLPVWHEFQASARETNQSNCDLEAALETHLRHTRTMDFHTAFAYVKQLAAFRDLSETHFLNALRDPRRLVLDFSNPEIARIQPRRLRMTIREFAEAVLMESDGPLLPEEILSRATTRFGSDAVQATWKTMIGSLIPEHGFFLLGPRQFGLRNHFATVAAQWPLLRRECESLLRAKNRPVSTIEAVQSGHVTSATISYYELTQLLREDPRFIDLGKHLFALTEWQITERDVIRDLIPRVLREAGRALRVAELFTRLQAMRSLSDTGLAAQLRRNPAVRCLPGGYYGLKEWNGEELDPVFQDRAVVERAVLHAPAPITFANLCSLFGLSFDSRSADVLWRTCASSHKLRRAPDKKTPETLLIHKLISLQQCLAQVARDMGRPARAYELQWELNGRFGELFADVELNKISARLARSNRFVETVDGQFIVSDNFSIDQYDTEAIHSACLSIFRQSNEILGCDELLDRLEEHNAPTSDISPDILAVILRTATQFQEVGSQRFRLLA